jgi:hypothetical protein
MCRPAPTFTRAFATLVGVASATAVAAAVLGWVATVAHRERVDGWTIAVGCGVSWLASCLGAVPVAKALSSEPNRMANAILAATAVRFVAVLALLIPLVFSGWFDRTVLVVSVGASYLLMLFVDTLLATGMMKRVFKEGEN